MAVKEEQDRQQAFKIISDHLLLLNRQNYQKSRSTTPCTTPVLHQYNHYCAIITVHIRHINYSNKYSKTFSARYLGEPTIRVPWTWTVLGIQRIFVLKFVNLLILPMKEMTIVIIWRAEIKLENPKGSKEA